MAVTKMANVFANLFDNPGPTDSVIMQSNNNAENDSDATMDRVVTLTDQIILNDPDFRNSSVSSSNGTTNTATSNSSNTATPPVRTVTIGSVLVSMQNEITVLRKDVTALRQEITEMKGLMKEYFTVGGGSFRTV